jgi:hypothetical protein
MMLCSDDRTKERLFLPPEEEKKAPMRRYDTVRHSAIISLADTSNRLCCQ